MVFAEMFSRAAAAFMPDMTKATLPTGLAMLSAPRKYCFAYCG